MKVKERQGRGREIGSTGELDPIQGGKESDSIVTDDNIFQALSNRRRRQSIKYLCEVSKSVTVGELAEHIAAIENNKPVKELSSYERKLVYISLYQNHLPKMDDWNVIEYDKDRKTVQLLCSEEKLDQYLRAPTDSGANLAPTAVAIFLGANVLIGIFQLGQYTLVSPSVWTLLGAVGLVVVTGFKLHGSTAQSLFHQSTPFRQS